MRTKMNRNYFLIGIFYFILKISISHQLISPNESGNDNAGLDKEYINSILTRDFGNHDDDDITKRKNISYAGSSGTCDGTICDPARYHEIRSALCGYNVFQGEPYSIVDGGLDPGVKHQIFEPAKEDKKGRFVLTGITAIDQKSCSAELSSEVITTVQNFKKKIDKVTNLGFGIDLSVFGVDAGAHWEHTSTMNYVSEFLRTEKGAISIAYAQCTTSKISVDYFDLPKFKTGFQNAVYFLAEANNLNEQVQMFYFKRFIDQYGTHYMTGTEMGATMMETRFLTQIARRSYSKDLLNLCTEFRAHIKYEKDATASAEGKMNWKKCKDFEDERESKRHSLVKKDTFVTKGSSPPEEGSITKWATQSFTPVPLRMELKAISELFHERVLHGQGIKDIDVKALRKWFVPMLGQYCKVMGIDCKFQGGCGFADNCKLNEDCVIIDPKKQTYKCVVNGRWSTWSEWSACPVKCGTGQQTRRRACNNPPPGKGGIPCKGESVQYKECKKGSCGGEILECKWLNGGDGKLISCPHNFVGTAACGTGTGPIGDCDDGWFTRLKCCRITAQMNNYCSRRESPISGYKMSCPRQEVLTSYCGSGTYRNCWAGSDKHGRWVYFYFNCCGMRDYQVEEDKCYWQMATYGKTIECNRGDIMTGACGVGGWSTEKCENNTHLGIKCCPFSKKQK